MSVLTLKRNSLLQWRVSFFVLDQAPFQKGGKYIFDVVVSPESASSPLKLNRYTIRVAVLLPFIVINDFALSIHVYDLHSITCQKHIIHEQVKYL